MPPPLKWGTYGGLVVIYGPSVGSKDAPLWSFLQFSSIQSLSQVWLFAIPWTAALQASLSITNSQSLLKLMTIESVMPSNHFILSFPSPPLKSIDFLYREDWGNHYWIYLSWCLYFIQLLKDKHKQIYLPIRRTLISTFSHEIKRPLLLGRKAVTNLDSILKKQRYPFANKGLYSQRYGFSSSHGWMWQLDNKKGQAPEN